MDFTKTLFRASSNGDIMTSSTGEITEKQLITISELTEKAKAKPLTPTQEETLRDLIKKRDTVPPLSQTCVKRILKVYAQSLGREEETRSRYMEKGTVVEQDSITLDSRIRKIMIYKNEKQLENQWVSGNPDAGNHKATILKATEIIDYKSSWSLITFLNAKFSATNADYQWQGDTYMGLVPSAKQFRLVYCLVNSPAEIIAQEKKNLKFRMYDVIDEDASPEYVEGCRQIERNHIFDMATFREQYPWFEFHSDLDAWAFDIPMESRRFEIVIPRNDERIQQLYRKIERCRQWMKENL